MRPSHMPVAQGKTHSLWEKMAHVATITSSLAAAAALIASTSQFRENLRVQENAVFLQNKSLQTERASKAAELFEKYLDVRGRTTDLPPGPKRDAFYVNRNNRGLLILDAIYSSTRGDQQWENIVFYSLMRYESFARERKILCMSLTDDFQAFIDKMMPDVASQKCHDMNESE